MRLAEADIAGFFQALEAPIYFVSVVPITLLGLEPFVPSLINICFYDVLEGQSPSVFTPLEGVDSGWADGVDIVNALLMAPQTQDLMQQHGGRGYVLALFFDENTERLVEALGLTLLMPGADVRRYLDNKLVTTYLGERANFDSVPNVLLRIASYRQLMKAASEAGLGDRLVVQLPYGDSGRTTYFIDSERDWRRCEKLLTGQDAKVMRRINPACGTIEAVCGEGACVVGPPLAELVGFAPLTPYRGGWCGNESGEGWLSETQRNALVVSVRRLGEVLRDEGYRGSYCVDFLLDRDSGAVYLGELNPRLSGATPISSLITGKYCGLPLMLFHLLEFMGIPYMVDTDEYERRWQMAGVVAHCVLKRTAKNPQRIDQVPPSGLWAYRDGDAEYVQGGQFNSWPGEANFLRLCRPGDGVWPGADLGVIFLSAQGLTAKGNLSQLARRWIKTLAAKFSFSDFPSL